jgi:CPA1 family monovalent cation:H+ antiporter
MSGLGAAAAIVTLAALFAWLNHRYLRKPQSIALLLFSLALSLALVGLGTLGMQYNWLAREAVRSLSLDRTLLDGALSFLLFAGALKVDLGELARRKWAVAFLALAGVVVSALLIGTAMWGVLRMLGFPAALPWALVFGALISPTDPIAVLALLRQAKADKSLSIKMAGESLLNDGVGIVLFVLFLGLATSGAEASGADVALLFAREAGGGALFGLAIGSLAYRMLAAVDAYDVEILLTLALVMGGYAAALALGISGPIAVVVAGVLIGNQGRRYAMSERTRERIDMFWELLDEVLNAALFVMIGLELLVIHFDLRYAGAAALAIPVVLVARFLSVGVAALIPRLRREFPPRVVALLTWGGLRGGISIALALSLPESPHREPIITVTYVVVLFTILVQGLTFSRALRRLA